MKAVRIILLASLFFTYLFWGILKIAGVHFSESNYVINTKEIDLTKLTFFFFSRSPVYVKTLRVFQTIAALLLIFKKSRFIGLLVYLPIVVNTFLLNIFYHFGIIPTLFNFCLSVSCLFLIILDYRKNLFEI